MTNQFSTTMNPYMYPQNYPNTGSPKSGVSTFGMMTLGAIGGGAAGYFLNRHPVSKAGEVSDEFAKKAFDKQVNKNLSSKGKEFFEQVNRLVKKIDKAKDAESLKKLIKENPLALRLNEAGISLDTYLNSINADNFKKIKQNIKQDVEKMTQSYYEKFKTITQACWDKTNKKFVKPTGMQDNVFEIIKKTNTNQRIKKALKYGGITAGVLGALTIGYKMLTASK